MSGWRNTRFNHAAVPPPGTKPQPPQKVPQAFIETMKRLSSDKSQTHRANQRQAQSSGMKWKSSFKPIGDEEENSEDRGADTSEGFYDPYSPLTSDTEGEQSESPGRDTTLERQRLSPGRGSRWDLPYVEPGSRTMNNREFGSGSRRPKDGRGPEPEGVDRPGYGSMSRPLDQRGCSPDRSIHSSSKQRFPPPRSQQAVEEERTAQPEYRREMSSTVRISPPRVSWYSKYPATVVDKGLNRDHVSPTVTKSRSKNVVMDKNFIACDLCDIVVANGQEMDEHLESKSHWDTLEHIQQNNNYDDMAIAFLQDVMLHKSHKYSRAVEDSALPTLQENDHMTKVDMFHCAACKVFVYSSVAEVQSHVTSREHLSNTKEFEMQQRQACLDRAKSTMQKLQPQLEIFLKGGSPFQ